MTIKHSIILVAALLLILSSLQNVCNAQETSAPVRIGLKGGLNLANLDTKDVVNNSTIVGFNLGLFSKLPLTRSIALQPELYFTSKGSVVTYKNVFVDGTARFNLNYLEVPLLLVFNPIDLLNIHFGPYVSYLVSGTVKNESSVNVFNFENNINADDYNRIDAGIAVGAGVDLGALSIGARYNFGLTKVGKERTFLGTTYTFPDARNGVLNVYVSLSLN